VALWICDACGTAYSVDAPRCPQCGDSVHHDDWDEQPLPIPASQALPVLPATPVIPAQKTPKE
jgi:ABC-type ATPase with predicted acetyltransferase domain